MRFPAYNWSEYKLGHGDGMQDRAEGRSLSLSLQYNNDRADDAYFDGYTAGIAGLRNKADTGLPCAYYTEHPFIGMPCRYRFMGNDWRVGIAAYGYSNRGDQLIGFAVYDESQDAVVHCMMENISFHLGSTDATMNAQGA